VGPNQACASSGFIPRKKFQSSVRINVGPNRYKGYQMPVFYLVSILRED